MKLRDYSATLDEKLSEFDLWITPTLGEIRDTSQFLVNLTALKRGFNFLETITDSFRSYTCCSPTSLANGLLELIENQSDENALELLHCVYNVFLLATGKTDNNLKCQFPIQLRRINVLEYPKKMRNRWVMKPLPRVLEMDNVISLTVNLREQKDFQRFLTRNYIELIISDVNYQKQLWSLGNAYVTQKQSGNETYLISSIVVFQSRGSITATQGHIPEEILRHYMSDWGLKAGVDYNEQDVEIGELLDGMPADPTIKKRKYDFIIPYQSRQDGAKVFIQSQFYAGDSGSVSHKVVDQTDSSRNVTLRKFPNAIFVEYLDGAGYYASLNGDLKKMLAKPTTKDFIQIKTAPLKLRRELQGINFLTTLEIEHAIIRSSGNLEEVRHILENEGYTHDEISMAIDNAVQNQDISVENNSLLSIRADRYPVVRRYCFLDLIANYGDSIPDNSGSGYLIVAGYSHHWGLPQATLIRTALEVIPNLQNYWQNPVDPFDDIQWLLSHELVKAK